MKKIKLTQLFTNPNFTMKGEKEKIHFNSNKYLKPYIKIDDTWYTLIRPIKNICVIFNHMLQTTEIELSTDDNQTLLHIPIETPNLEDTHIEYEEL